MNKRTYSGAYFRRRYSNASTSTIGGTATYSTTNKIPFVPSGDTVTIVLGVNDASMGTINAIVLQSANPGATEEPVTTRDGRKTLTVARGSTVRVSASAATGYVLKNFTGTPTPPATNTARFDVVANTNCNFTAVFRQVSTPTYHTVAVVYNSTRGTVAGNGLTPEPGYPDGNGQMRASMSVQNGNSVTLTAQPKQGYRFVRWEGLTVAGKLNQTSANPQIVQQVFANLNLKAVFEPESGGGSDDPHDKPNPDEPTPGGTPTPGNDPNMPMGPASLANKAIAFAKQWWWALLIVGYIVYKEMKGGRQ